MSASSHTDWFIRCDAESCVRQESTDTIALPFGDGTATGLRRVLKRRGWAVAVRTYYGVPQRQRLDFCPEHKPQKLETGK